MAGFQPLDFNYQLDPTLVQPPAPSYSLSPNTGIGTGVQAGAAAAAGGSGIGGLFANLFADDGLFSRNSLFGGTDTNTGIRTQGWAPIALGLGQAILGGIQGNRAQKLAEDQFKESKRQFNLNFDTQRKTINTQLEDRQRARVASNPGAYQDVDSYLKKNGV